jgi:hypothetical protein
VSVWVTEDWLKIDLVVDFKATFWRLEIDTIIGKNRKLKFIKDIFHWNTEDENKKAKESERNKANWIIV